MAYGNYSPYAGFKETHGISGKYADGKKRVFDTGMCVHVWAQQSPDNAPEGRNGKGSVFFKGNILYSYGTHFPVGIFTDHVAPNGKRVVLITSERYEGQATNAHVNQAYYAIDQEKFEVVRAPDEAMTSARHGHWQTAFETIIHYQLKELEASLAYYCNTRKSHWTYDHMNYTRVQMSPSAMAARLDDTELRKTADTLGVALPEYDLEAMRQKILDTWAEWMKGEPKRKKARDARARRACIEKFDKAFDTLYGNGRHYRAWSCREKLRVALAEMIELRPDVSQLYLEKYQTQLLKEEIDANFQFVHPDASNVVWERRYGSYRNRVTINEWLKGKGKSPAFHWHGTLMRKKGGRLETTMGVEVPWAHAVKMFTLAQMSYTNRADFVPPMHVPIGHFKLDRIDADGTLKAGCHTLQFKDMLALACQEQPDVVNVSARYPVPMVI